MTELGPLLADGRTSQVYRFGNDGAAKVLNPSTPRHWAQIEASFTTAVADLGVPAPEVRDVIEVDGRATIVFERIEGRSLWQRMVEDPQDIRALTREMVDLQRNIHTAGVPDGLPSLVDRLASKIDRADELSSDERSRARSLLSALPVGAALLHGDLHPGNILLGPHGPVVIDWFDATIGHPDADLARTDVLITSEGATDLRHLPSASRGLMQPLCDEFRALAGRSPDASTWRRLRAAGRLAEDADLDTTGLLAIWRQGSAVDDE